MALGRSVAGAGREMTIDQAIDKASAEIDALLQVRLDDMACQMIANGADPTKPRANEDS